MATLAIGQSDYISERSMEQALARSLHDIRGAAALAKVGIDEIGGVHHYAAHKFAVAIDGAHHIVKAARCVQKLSPHRQTALTQLTRSALLELQMGTDEMAAAIVDVLSNI